MGTFNPEMVLDPWFMPKKPLSPYAQLLQRKEWQQKREDILKKDNHRCTKCGTRATKSIWIKEKQKKLHFFFKENEPC